MYCSTSITLSSCRAVRAHVERFTPTSCALAKDSLAQTGPIQSAPPFFDLRIIRVDAGPHLDPGARGGEVGIGQIQLGLRGAEVGELVDVKSFPLKHWVEQTLRLRDLTPAQVRPRQAGA